MKARHYVDGVRVGECERRTGGKSAKAKNRNGVGKCGGPADESTVTNVKRGAAVIGHGIILVRQKAGGTGESTAEASAATASADVPVGVSQCVKAEQRDFLARSDPHVGNQLVLPEDSFGVILINVVVAV